MVGGQRRFLWTLRHPGDATLNTNWTPTAPLDFERWSARYLRWGPDPVNVVSEDAFHRVIDGPHGPEVYRISDHGNTLTLDSSPEIASLALADIRYRLGEHLEFGALGELSKSDGVVAELTARFPGLRPPMNPDPFETLIGAISAQQVNLTWAATTRRRLIEATSTLYSLDDVAVWQFPTPAEVLALSVADIRAMQFTTRKSEFILDLAQAALDGVLDNLTELSNDEVIARLTAIRGIGRWSAEIVLGRCLGRSDAVAAGDLAVRKAVSFTYLGSDTILSEDVVRDTAETWGDAANLVAHLLLETLTE